MPKNRLRKLRQEKGLTLKELSQQLKEKGTPLSTSSLIKYEREERKPKLETWLKLASFFGVSVSYLQGISENSEPLFTSDSSATELKQIINFFDSQSKGEKSVSPNDLINDIKHLPMEQRAVVSGSFSTFLYCIDFLIANDEYQTIASLGNLLGVILAVQCMEGRDYDIQDLINNYIDEAISRINNISKKTSNDSNN
ncbi:helix-turn-helix transcriptional regulator [Limosilactobacillus vaginalis]|uniref:Helix-turn-helix transcriptional regulator n=1 Tax=Limosilactobacillus vaginalis TaxID=1633 RepID=A0AAW5WTK8_9LACO|nr:helix-turn-helix transcriptional regulator [Limosilactobacillus vaginalis]MCZ3667752.1 helix-turn-helix transcriptional regulator [Limosilactobacillus vaginalis]